MTVHQSMRNLCKWIKRSSRNWLHMHSDCSVAQSQWRPHFATKLANWLIRSPVSYSVWGALHQLLYRQKVKDNDHLKQVLNRWWGMIGHKLINGDIDSGLNNWCQSFVITVNTLSIVYFNSVTFACYKRYSCFPVLPRKTLNEKSQVADRSVSVLTTLTDPERRVDSLPVESPQVRWCHHYHFYCHSNYLWVLCPSIYDDQRHHLALIQISYVLIHNLFPGFHNLPVCLFMPQIGLK